MIIHDLKTIFVHIPKTAGNYLTKNVLLPMSRDLLVVRGHQDGVNRFEVQGDITTRKHMTLEEYSRLVDVSDYYVVASVREPVERLVSLYYSPHRAMRLTKRGLILRAMAKAMNHRIDLSSDAYRQCRDQFSIRDFKRLVEREKNCSDYLEGYENTRGIFILRHNTLDSDIERFLDFFGCAVPRREGQPLNVSKRPVDESDQFPCMKRIVRQSKHFRDYHFLERIADQAINNQRAA